MKEQYTEDYTMKLLQSIYVDDYTENEELGSFEA